MEISMSSIPINFTAARRPRRPMIRMIPLEERIHAAVTLQAIARAAIHVPMRSGSRLAMRINAAIAEGPATNGMANGTIKDPPSQYPSAGHAGETPC